MQFQPQTLQFHKQRQNLFQSAHPRSSETGEDNSGCTTHRTLWSENLGGKLQRKGHRQDKDQMVLTCLCFDEQGLLIKACCVVVVVSLWTRLWVRFRTVIEKWLNPPATALDTSIMARLSHTRLVRFVSIPPMYRHS